MKQHYQQKNRRHNNNSNNNMRARPQNLGQRSLDSNGSDVKIRGTASHICKKYQSLARDAQLSGNRVRAESYLQHADHYYRIVLVAQAQQKKHEANQAPRDNRENREPRENNREHSRDRDGGRDNEDDGQAETISSDMDESRDDDREEV